MDIRATESEILELENKLLHPTPEPISLPLYFLRLITGDFSNEQELGRGGYGVVYKGLLRCGLIIAVKKIHGLHVVDDDRFKNEATFLMGIKHQNVVQLLGYCDETRGVMTKLPNGKCVVGEERTRMLCFEYVCNKGLDKYLSDESSGLEWNTRYEIIKGICCGLKFLHDCNIVHLDLKPQNILMDANMMPKIADFGLSRLLGEQKSHTITANRAGTMGYMSLEYISHGKISTKADIFSLGVIIIEILKGCREYPSYLEITETNIKYFIEKVFDNWRNRFKRAPKYTELELHTQQVKQCINIALKCVHPNSKRRPNAMDIMKILNAAERSSCLQNGEGSPIEHEMGSQKGVPPDVQRENEFAALIRSVMKYYAQPCISEDMWNKEISGSSMDMVKAVVAPPQPQQDPVLACAQRNEGSLATLHYQGARNASFWVAHKALAYLEHSLLKEWAATMNLGLGIEALKRELKYVKVILESTLGKVIHNLTLEDILMGLHDLVYDAENVLDEMEYFRIQDVVNEYSDEPPVLRFDGVEASRRIKHIVKQMELMRQEISSTITLLGSNWSNIPNIGQSRPVTTSQSIEPKLYGRKLMMDSIIHDITKGKHSTAILTVIPIVGPGGIGKTTLAQHIYHDGQAQQHFDIQVWTCVSLNFHVNKLIEEIQRYIPKVEGENTNSTTGELIGQRLKNKRLLLVLDDVWDCKDADEWKQLLVPFKRSQVQGNIIIVTTRFLVQAQMMVQKNDHSIYLQGLEIKEFKELFLEIVFDGDNQSRKDHTFLLETGFKIAGRLKGSPLAAKTVGRLLKTQLHLDHWNRVLESKEWEQSNGENDIMLALKLREAKALRVIFLPEATYDVEYLLCNFYNLLHLRCLRIGSSYPYKVRFPNQVSRFYHMMVLDANYHDNIIDLPKDNPQDIIALPKDIKNLVKLRHFLVRNDATHSNIAEVGKLKSMQELRSFRVRKEGQGFELREIGHLTDLCGSLSIYNLEKVLVKEEADKAKLLLKGRLHELILHWDNANRSTNDPTLEEHVLERLKPTNNLLKLYIEGHRGTACPLWLGLNLSVKNLESLCLEGVAWKTFPPIGELWLVNEPHRETILGKIPDKRFQNLRALQLHNLTMVERWRVHSPCQLFPFLELLIIHDCPKLVELWFSHSATCCQQGKEATVNLFPRLSELHIKNCPHLLSFPPVPWTEAPCSIWINRIGCLDKLICSCLNSEWSLRIHDKEDVSLPLPTLGFTNLPRDPQLVGSDGTMYHQLIGNHNHGGNVLSSNVTNITTTERTWWNVLAFHNLTRLKKLDMSNCQPLPLGCLQILPSLRTLNMSCSNNAFPFVEADSHVKCQIPVERLHISEWNASGKGLTQLLTCFPKLSDLTLEKCVKVTVLGVNVRGQQATEALLLPPQMTVSRFFCLPRCRRECDLLLLPSQLQELEIRNYPELSLRSKSNPHNKQSNGGGIQGLSSLRRLTISRCPKLLSTCSSSLYQKISYTSSFPFPSSLEYISIKDVVGMEETVPLSNLTSLTSLSLSNCWGLRGEGLVSLLSQGHLTQLSIAKMHNFFVDSEPSQAQPETPSHSSKLQEILIDDVAGFTAAPIHHGLLFSSLATLDICGDCKVACFTEEQEELLFVNSLEDITFRVCINLQYLPARLHTLPNLKILWINNCEAIQILPEDALPSSLQELGIIGCPEIQTLPKFCSPSSLQKLSIMNCAAIRTLPGYALPSSLQDLCIDRCPQIRSLPKDCLPNSLQRIQISWCPAIHSLPEVDDLPSSLQIIDVSCCGSDELKTHCRKLIGIIPIVRT